MVKADKIGDEMYLSFVNECLLKRRADFIDPVRKVSLDIGLNETKKTRKAVSVMKKDRQTFGVMFEQEVNLEVRFGTLLHQCH